MMPLFPKATINVSISKQEVLNSLADFIETGKYKFLGSSKWYRGTIKEDSFQMRRTYYTEWMFSPKKKEKQKIRSSQTYYVTKGSVVAAPLGSEIQLHIGLSKSFHVFMIIMTFFPFVFLYFAGGDKLGVGLNDLLKAVIFVCLPIVLIFYVSFILFSRKEMKIIKKDIEEYFEGSIIDIY